MAQTLDDLLMRSAGNGNPLLKTTNLKDKIQPTVKMSNFYPIPEFLGVPLLIDISTGYDRKKI